MDIQVLPSEDENSVFNGIVISWPIGVSSFLYRTTSTVAGIADLICKEEYLLAVGRNASLAILSI